MPGTEHLRWRHSAVQRNEYVLRGHCGERGDAGGQWESHQRGGRCQRSNDRGGSLSVRSRIDLDERTDNQWTGPRDVVLKHLRQSDSHADRSATLTGGSLQFALGSGVTVSGFRAAGPRILHHHRRGERAVDRNVRNDRLHDCRFRRVRVDSQLRHRERQCNRQLLPSAGTGDAAGNSSGWVARAPRLPAVEAGTHDTPCTLTVHHPPEWICSNRGAAVANAARRMGSNCPGVSFKRIFTARTCESGGRCGRRTRRAS